MIFLAITFLEFLALCSCPGVDGAFVPNPESEAEKWEILSKLKPDEIEIVWTSASTFPNGTLLQVCLNDNITLPWTFKLNAGSKWLLNEWYFTSTAPNDSTIKIASNYSARARDFASHSTTREVLSFGNAGLLLPTATQADSGFYDVHVHMRSSKVIYSQTAFVQTLDQPVTVNNDLVISLENESYFKEEDGTWPMTLKCGKFLKLGNPPVDLVWNMTNKAQVSSTTYDNGNFILTLTEPIQEGDYSCTLKENSMASKCHPSFGKSDGVRINGTLTRLSLVQRFLEESSYQIMTTLSPQSIANFALESDARLKHLENRIAKINDTEVLMFTEIKEYVKASNAALTDMQSTLNDLLIEDDRVKNDIIRTRNEIVDLEAKYRALKEKRATLEDELATMTAAATTFHAEILQAEKNELSESFRERQNESMTISELVIRHDEKLKSMDEFLINLNRSRSRVNKLKLDLKTHINSFDDEKINLYIERDDLLTTILDLQFDTKYFDPDPFGLFRRPSVDTLKRPFSCKDVREYDDRSGIHTLYLQNSKTVHVYCDQSLEGGGWTVIQRRQDGSVNFFRNWTEYELGFGNLETEFWIGLENLHQLTINQNSILRIDLMDFDGQKAYANYDTFYISDATDNYRLYVSGYSGNAEDSFESGHKGKPFSTFDKDNDDSPLDNCAEKHKGAWWYKSCLTSNLNGQYQQDAISSKQGIFWFKLKMNWESLKFVEMKIRQ